MCNDACGSHRITVQRLAGPNTYGQDMESLEFDFRPVRVVDDTFYGIARDEFDVQTVSVFRVATR